MGRIILSPSVTVTAAVDGAALFSLLSDWGSICDWAPADFIKSCRLAEDDSKTRIVTTGAGRDIRERLLTADAKTMQLRFSIVGDAPGGIEDYLATVTIRPAGPGQCTLTWQGQMAAPEGANAARITAGFEDSYRTLIRAAEAYLQGRC